MTTLALILLLTGNPPTPPQVAFAEAVDAQPAEWRPLLIALAWSESDFNHLAVSSAGACGILQLMPRWAGATCETLQTDIPYAVDAAVEELTKWRRNCGREYMVAAWNKGYGCCLGGWYHDKRKDSQPFNCTQRALDFQGKVWRRVRYIKRRL